MIRKEDVTFYFSDQQSELSDLCRCREVSGQSRVAHYKSITKQYKLHSGDYASLVQLELYIYSLHYHGHGRQTF